MLATIEGKIAETAIGSAIVEVNGFGYEVRLTTTDSDGVKVGDKARFYLHEHLREDAHDLYGFSKAESKQLFEQLISVSGVGPKVAMAILSAVSLEQLTTAIASANSDLLQGVSGVGKKMAERIVVDLKTKVLAGLETVDLTSGGGDAAFEGLKQLGYSARQAQEALSKVPAKFKTDEERLTEALKGLSK